MKVNRNFCKPTVEGDGYTYAPVVLPPNPHEPTEAEYNAAGWYRNGIEPPSPPEGKIVSAISYVIADNKCVAVYTYTDAPKRMRVFCTADIIEALMQRELWAEARAWIESQGWIDMVLATKEVREDDPNFTMARAALQQALSVSDADVEEILAYAEVK